MAVTFPVAGSFSAFGTRFIDPAWGFASGWNYAIQWLFVMPLEIMAATITLDFWDTGIPPWASINDISHTDYRHQFCTGQDLWRSRILL